MTRGSRPGIAFALVALAAGVLAIVAPTASSSLKPKDQCSNLSGVQKKIPAGYKRGAKLKCVRKSPPQPNCTGNTVLEPDGKCHPIPPPTPPAPVAWWPSDYEAWIGAGNAFATNNHEPLVAYKPSTCPTTSGGQIPNGGTDSSGRICWSYLVLTNVAWANGDSGCKSVFVSLSETSGGVIVGNTIGLAKNVPNGTPALVHGSVSPAGFPSMTIAISSIDCDDI